MERRRVVVEPQQHQVIGAPVSAGQFRLHVVDLQAPRAQPGQDREPAAGGANRIRIRRIEPLGALRLGERRGERGPVRMRRVAQACQRALGQRARESVAARRRIDRDVGQQPAPALRVVLEGDAAEDGLAVARDQHHQVHPRLVRRPRVAHPRRPLGRVLALGCDREGGVVDRHEARHQAIETRAVGSQQAAQADERRHGLLRASLPGLFRRVP